jgi:2-polyprenyl-6-methoxyphenol hydroxylase-like FAD-dependent oxidoreductase
VLRGGVDRFINVEVLLEHRATEVWQAPSVAGLRFVGADGEVREASARYLVACDGAVSPVRKQLGIGQESLDFDEWWTVVDAWPMRPTPLPKRTTQFYPFSARGAVRADWEFAGVNRRRCGRCKEVGKHLKTGQGGGRYDNA